MYSDRTIVFGASGYLGSEICRRLEEDAGSLVVRAGRGKSFNNDVDVSSSDWVTSLGPEGSITGVVWAQGENASDSVIHSSDEAILRLFSSNTLFIISTLRELMSSGVLAKNSRGVVLGSVWQRQTRSEKLSYGLSKTALGSLIPSIALDLEHMGFVLNAVLPGPVRSPMTSENVPSSALKKIEEDSIGGKLVTARNVADVTHFLLSDASIGLQAQELVVDNGWSKVRRV